MISVIFSFLQSLAYSKNFPLITLSPPRQLIHARVSWAKHSTLHSQRMRRLDIVLWLLYDFTSLKNDVNVPSKSNKQKIWNSSRRKKQDPDPVVRGRNPRIRIRTKMSRIPFTPVKVSQPEHFMEWNFRRLNIQSWKPEAKDWCYNYSCMLL
jgi:hypothetical protein